MDVIIVAGKMQNDAIKESQALINSLLLLTTGEIRLNYLSNYPAKKSFLVLRKHIRKSRLPFTMRFRVLNESRIIRYCKDIKFDHKTHHAGVWGAAKLFLPWLYPDVSKALILDTDMIFVKDPFLLWHEAWNTPDPTTIEYIDANYTNWHDGYNETDESKRRLRLRLETETKVEVEKNEIQNKNSSMITRIYDMDSDSARRLGRIDAEGTNGKRGSWIWKMPLNANHPWHVCSCVMLIDMTLAREMLHIKKDFLAALQATHAGPNSKSLWRRDDNDLFHSDVGDQGVLFALYQQRPQLFETLNQHWNVDHCHQYYGTFENSKRIRPVGILHRNCIGAHIEHAVDKASDFFTFFNSYPLSWHDGLFKVNVQFH